MFLGHYVIRSHTPGIEIWRKCCRRLPGIELALQQCSATALPVVNQKPSKLGRRDLAFGL